MRGLNRGIPNRADNGGRVVSAKRTVTMNTQPPTTGICHVAITIGCFATFHTIIVAVGAVGTGTKVVATAMILWSVAQAICVGMLTRRQICYL